MNCTWKCPEWKKNKDESPSVDSLAEDVTKNLNIGQGAYGFYPVVFQGRPLDKGSTDDPQTNKENLYSKNISYQTKTKNSSSFK